MSAPKYKLVLVEWADSFGCQSQWGEIPDKLPKPPRCFSVGWLVRENKDLLIIVPHWHDKNEDINSVESGCGDMAIPRRAVIRIKRLKPCLTQS